MNASLLSRIERLESSEAIRQLACRYALAVDARDINTWLGLFVEDVDCGRRGNGREALRSFIDAALRCFYRSIHLVCGHVIDFVDDDHACGTVYCRAEHESGGEWIIMTIVYFDAYERRKGGWFFVRREEEHWYSADQLTRPSAPFQLWKVWAERLPRLPARFPTWRHFWRESSDAAISALTAAPIK